MKIVCYANKIHVVVTHKDLPEIRQKKSKSCLICVWCCILLSEEVDFTGTHGNGLILMYIDKTLYLWVQCKQQRCRLSYSLR